ncbi:uncharacterized protein TNCV_163871 [Trichonephila clavipes]|nr:uncharacterized protein TNCV_163871 [Trichonephila clavipes]
MALSDRSVISRAIAHHIESVTHHLRVPFDALRAEWSVCKTFIAWSTLDAEPQMSPPTMTASAIPSRYWSQLPILAFRAWPQPYFNRIMHDHTWHAFSKGSSSIAKLNCFPAGSLSGYFTDRKHVVHGCSTIDPDYTPQLPHQMNFGNVWKLLDLLYPKKTSKVSLN